MELSKRDKEDMLLNVRIEMERMFSILTNHYNRAERERSMPMLTEVETLFKQYFQTVSKDYLGE